MLKKVFITLSSFVGIVFLVSGIGKSLVSYEFSQIIVQYGFDIFRFFAPLIIMFEIMMGLLLFFHIWQKQISFLSLCFLGIVSFIYLYGWLFINITDCGCFGHFSFLNMPPLFTIVRNIILMSILLYIFFKSKNLQKPAEKSEIIIMGIIFSAVCFIIGYTFEKKEYEYTTEYITGDKHINIDIDIENSVLSDFFTPCKDSTYFIFVFSYQCPHCYNSIENLKQYERLGVADRTLAISFSNDSTTINKFTEIFEPNFEIKNYSAKRLFKLTTQFPISYYIKNNIIKMEIRGILPSGYLLQQEISKIDK